MNVVNKMHLPACRSMNGWVARWHTRREEMHHFGSIANFVPRVLRVVGGYSKRWVLTGPAEISEAIK